MRAAPGFLLMKCRAPRGLHGGHDKEMKMKGNHSPAKAVRRSTPRAVAVVVLNYRHAFHTIACAESLLRLADPADWIILVDNGSDDDSAPRLRQWMGEQARLPGHELTAETPEGLAAALETVNAACPHETAQKGDGTDRLEQGLWLIRSPINKGYAGGNNLGIALACRLGADAVWVLNNDTEVEPQALGAMRDRLFACSRPGLCGSLILYHDDPRFVQCLGGGVTNRWTGLSWLIGYRLPLQRARKMAPAAVEAQLNFIYGASVMASRAFIETVGLMYEGYFMYCEEQDWAYSAAGRFDLAYAPGAVVRHHEGISTGWPAAAKPACLLRMTRSRIRLTARHFPLALPTVCGAVIFAAFRLAARRILLRFGIGRRKLH